MYRLVFLPLLAFIALSTASCHAKVIIEESNGVQLHVEFEVDETGFQYRTNYYATNNSEDTVQVWMVLVDGNNLNFDLTDKPVDVEPGATVHLGHTEAANKAKESSERYVFQVSSDY